MRKLILFNMVTLDGFFEGPDGDISWHSTDEEFNDFSNEQLDSADGVVLGRRTYELFESYWPHEGHQTDPETAQRLDAAEKIVCSTTLGEPDWVNTRVVRDGAAEVAKVKEQPGKNILLFGSANLAASLARAGLIDEVRLIVNPVAIGAGRPHFEGWPASSYELLEARPFASGNVLLRYGLKAG